METAAQASWTAEAFLIAEQESFGPAWRYELVDGRIVGHAAPTPAHGAILSWPHWSLERAATGKYGRVPSRSG